MTPQDYPPLSQQLKKTMTPKAITLYNITRAKAIIQLTPTNSPKPTCLNCCNSNQVWVNQRTGLWKCHRIGCE